MHHHPPHLVSSASTATNFEPGHSASQSLWPPIRASFPFPAPAFHSSSSIHSPRLNLHIHRPHHTTSPHTTVRPFHLPSLPSPWLETTTPSPQATPAAQESPFQKTMPPYGILSIRPALGPTLYTETISTRTPSMRRHTTAREATTTRTASDTPSSPQGYAPESPPRAASLPLSSSSSAEQPRSGSLPQSATRHQPSSAARSTSPWTTFTTAPSPQSRSDSHGFLRVGPFTPFTCLGTMHWR